MRRPLVPWSRPEPFGAWVRLDDTTLIAVDPELAERLAVPHSKAALPGPTRPLEVHIAVTTRCNAPCEGCYMNAHPGGAEPPFDHIVAMLTAARDAGVSTVALGGGEPLLRRDIGEIAQEARALGLVPVMTTSGAGLTRERARSLSAFAQINVSHDGAGGAYQEVRGWDGEAIAERAIESIAAAGIKVGANVVLTRRTFDALEATSERVAERGAGEIQLLRYKPGGRAAGPAYEDRRLTPAQIELLWPMIRRISGRKRLRVRIDCAMVPLLSGALIAEGDAATRLAAFGVFGCEAARHLGALRVNGGAAPCSFFSSVGPDEATLTRLSAKPSSSGASLAAWGSSPELDRIRAYHASPPEPCRSCELFPVCRGGCQVVSRHATDGCFAPDPECPRVRLHAQAQSAP